MATNYTTQWCLIALNLTKSQSMKKCFLYQPNISDVNIKYSFGTDVIKICVPTLGLQVEWVLLSCHFPSEAISILLDCLVVVYSHFFSPVRMGDSSTEHEYICLVDLLSELLRVMELISSLYQSETAWAMIVKRVIEIITCIN